MFASLGLLAVVPATPANADPACQPGGVYAVFARGSGAKIGSDELGVFQGSVFNVLSLIAPSVPFNWAELGNLDGDRTVGQDPNEPHEYPAVAAPWNAAPWIYGPSVETGTNELVNHLNERASRPVGLGCQHEAVVLGGYSQGADVVGWALARDGSDGRVSLSAEAKRRIGFVALYGDPKFNCGGSWVRGNVPCTFYPGVQGVLGHRSPYIPNNFTGRTGSWCDVGDPICTGNQLFTIFGSGNHGSIYKGYLIFSSSAEVAVAALVKRNELNQGGAQVVLSAYVDSNGQVPPTPTIPTPSVYATASTSDQQYGGDYNGDGFGDVAMLHKSSGGGVNIHVLYGGTGSGMFQNSATWATDLTFPTWDWTKLKVVSGRFNTDQYADLALFYQRSDGGMDLHVAWGGTQPFSLIHPVRNLTGAEGWNWNNSKLVSGDFNGDWLDDIAIGHLLADSGVGIHILYGATGNPFQNTTTLVRQLPNSAGWNWSQIKLAAGQFNNDDNADLVIAHQGGDGGIGLHILNGCTSNLCTPFTNTSTFLRHLTGAAGWNWSQVKLAAGAFNSDNFADIAILHQVADGGIGVHMVYGNPTPFQDSTTFVRQLGGDVGWRWANVKLAAGMFNADGYSDVAMLHGFSDDSFGAYTLYGNPAPNTFGAQYESYIRWFGVGSGWRWSLVKLN